jgi:hypothetical protein
MRNVFLGSFYATIEGTSGTEQAPSASTDAIALVEPLSPSPAPGSQVARPNLAQGLTLNSGRSLKPSAFAGDWPLQVHVRGTKNGAAYAAGNLPELHALWLASGFSATLVTTGGSESVTYRPAATSLPTVTCHYHQDGLLHKLIGAVGSSMDLSWDAGGPIVAAITMRGVAPVVTTATAPASPVFGVALPPVVENVAFTLGGSDVGILRRFQLSIPQTISTRLSANAPSALAPMRVRKRTTNATIVLEEDTLAVRDWDALLRAQTRLAAGWTLGASAGVAQYNRVACTMAAVAVQSVERSNDSGTAIVTIGLELSDTTPDAADAVAWVHT